MNVITKRLRKLIAKSIDSKLLVKYDIGSVNENIEDVFKKLKINGKIVNKLDDNVINKLAQNGMIDNDTIIIPSGAKLINIANDGSDGFALYYTMTFVINNIEATIEFPYDDDVEKTTNDFEPPINIKNYI